MEFTVHAGSKRPRADLAIFLPGSKHTPQNAKIIIECKREDIPPTDKDDGVGQLKSYMANCANCRFGMWIGSEVQVWEKAGSEQGGYEFLEAADIPKFGSDAPQPPRFADLVPAEADLRGVFRRCHDYIYGNQGLRKDLAFHELLKLIFCKVQDEDDVSNALRFFISNEQRRSPSGQAQLREALDSLFADVKRRYSYIFSADDTLELHDRVLAYIVGELQRYSLVQTRADVKGVAYEQIVGANLRGDRGEFFTPRSVCKMASEMVLATFPQNQWLNINVLDPAAGTGGFLVALMDVWREHIYQLEQERWGENGQRVDSEARNRLREVTSNHLFGIDFNPDLVKAGQMNLVMHGDGSTNVFHADSLLHPGEWPQDDRNNVAQRIRLNYFDAILTNPPFGSKIPINDPQVLSQFEITAPPVAQRQSRSVPPDRLFIERCLQLLRPSGRLAIVLPDSILTNPGLVSLRRWILGKARVIASVDLPKETFQPHTGTQTSVLLLQKKSEEEIAFEQEASAHRQYEVFLATPGAVGKDRRGNTLYCRTSEGQLIEVDDSASTLTVGTGGEPVVERTSHRRLLEHDELPSVAESFRDWASDPTRIRWLNA